MYKIKKIIVYYKCFFLYFSNLEINNFDIMYLFFNPSGIPQGTQSIFASKPQTIESSTHACVDFYYNMFGKDMGSLCKSDFKFSFKGDELFITFIKFKSRHLLKRGIIYYIRELENDFLSL